MSETEKARHRLILNLVKPESVYELHFVVISEFEWAASAALVGGSDRRFRFTQGKLFDEANIGDGRAA